MKSVRKGDLVWYETAAGARRLGYVHAVFPAELPAYARVAPYLPGEQRYAGRAKVLLTAIVRRASARTGEEVLAALDAPTLPGMPAPPPRRRRRAAA